MDSTEKNSAFDRIAARSSDESREFVKRSLDVAEEVYKVLESKNMTQKQLAIKLGKSEAEVSKWLSGFHNFTFKTVQKIELALGERLIVTKSFVDEIKDKEIQRLKRKVNALNKKLKDRVSTQETDDYDRLIAAYSCVSNSTLQAGSGSDCGIGNFIMGEKDGIKIIPTSKASSFVKLSKLELN